MKQFPELPLAKIELICKILQVLVRAMDVGIFQYIWALISVVLDITQNLPKEIIQYFFLLKSIWRVLHFGDDPHGFRDQLESHRLKKQTNRITKDIKHTNQITRDLGHRAMGLLGIFQPIWSDYLHMGSVNSPPQGALIPFAVTKLSKSCVFFFLRQPSLQEPIQP